MQLSVELSFYPFEPEFKPPIKGVIARLNTYPGLRMQTFPTATVLMGEHRTLMDALSDCLVWSYDKYGRCVFVAKFLPGYAALGD